MIRQVERETQWEQFQKQRQKFVSSKIKSSLEVKDDEEIL